MTTQSSTARMRKRAETIDQAAAAELAEISEDAGAARAVGAESAMDSLQDAGRDLLRSARALFDEAGRQARLHPLATFGIALIAGIIATRALKR